MIKYFVFIIILSSVFFMPCALFSQTSSEFSRFENFFEIRSHKHNWSEQLRNNDNEINFTFSVLFFLYKEVLSSQDIESCVMHPSCSVYAIENIKKNGVFIGLLNSFDRLTRCNPGKNKHLPIDKETGKYFDPVD